MLALLLSSLTLACNTTTTFPEEPNHGMGVRFTRRGLEKFCQKGYEIIPDIISALPPFRIPEITLGSIKFTLSNVKVRAVRVATMDVYLQSDSLVKIKPRDKATHLPRQLRAAVIGISGSLNCALTLREIAENTSPQTRISPAAPTVQGLWHLRPCVSV